MRPARLIKISSEPLLFRKSWKSAPCVQMKILSVRLQVKFDIHTCFGVSMLTVVIGLPITGALS